MKNIWVTPQVSLLYTVYISLKTNEDPLIIDVRRSHVLKDSLKEAKRAKFDCMRVLKVCHIWNTNASLIYAIIQVRFVGEGAVDHGGPVVNFFVYWRRKLFHGKFSRKFFIAKCVCYSGRSLHAAFTLTCSSNLP